MTAIRNKRFQLIAACALLICVCAVAFAVRAWGSSADKIAAAIIADCGTIDGDHAPCYEQEVPALYPKLSVPQLFDVIRDIRAADPAYQFCHVLAHKIGERVVAENPDAWVDAIPLNPSDGYCSNGFIHGVTGGRFRADVLDEQTIESLKPDFRRACEAHGSWKPSDLDRAICYHGIGHLYDFITDANLNRALVLCKETVPEQFQDNCVSGVFMQIYQPLEPDDYALIERMKVKPTIATLRAFCATFKNPEYIGSCLRESWPLHEGMLDGTGAKAYCTGHPNKTLEDRCYVSAFTIIGRLRLAEPDGAAQACMAVPSKRQGTCFSIVSNAIIEENRNASGDAVAFCMRAPQEADRNDCLGFLMQTAPFNFGSNAGEYARFCAALPEEFSQRCNQSIPRQRPTL